MLMEDDFNKNSERIVRHFNLHRSRLIIHAHCFLFSGTSSLSKFYDFFSFRSQEEIV
jgi:hypothetical protein